MGFPARAAHYVMEPGRPTPCGPMTWSLRATGTAPSYRRREHAVALIPPSGSSHY